MTTHDESPIIRTSSRRMAKGIAIIVILTAVGTGILIPDWKNMAHNLRRLRLFNQKDLHRDKQGFKPASAQLKELVSLNLQKAQVQRAQYYCNSRWLSFEWSTRNAFNNIARCISSGES